MSNVTLKLAKDVYRDLREHLLPESVTEEERAAFVFAKSGENNGCALRSIEWVPIAEQELAHSSAFGISLTEETQARMIKRAHDLGTSLVEFHSHPFQKQAQFSGMDTDGFLDFVPHVRWRLKGKPYIAFVFGQTSFDALAWSGKTTTPQPFGGLVVGNRILRPTGLTLKQLQGGSNERSFR